LTDQGEINVINKYSNVPLYSQLKNIIIEKLRAANTRLTQNTFRTGFCELYNISRPTVRQAISELTIMDICTRKKEKELLFRSPIINNHKKVYRITDSILDNEITNERDIISIEKITTEISKNSTKSFHSQ